MATYGRKNVRGKAGVRFKTPFTTSKHKNMIRNLVTELVIHEKVTVTTSVVKDLVKMADHLVTLAKRGDLHARRQAASVLRKVKMNNKEGTTALDKLFDDLAVRFKDRTGGYARAIKAGTRRGDNAQLVLVTWSE